MPRRLWWLIEIPAFVAFLWIPTLVGIRYGELPATIATHFRWDGSPNGYGEKGALLTIMAVGLFVYAVLSAVPFLPQNFQVPGERTTRKVEIAIGMIRVVKLEVTVFMAYLIWAMIEIGLGDATGISGLLHQLFLFGVLGTVGTGLFLTTRNAV